VEASDRDRQVARSQPIVTYRPTNSPCFQRSVRSWIIPNWFSVFDSGIRVLEKAVLSRVLQPVPEPDPKDRIWKSLRNRAERLGKKMTSLAHWLTHEEVNKFITNHYSGAKRARYLLAREKLRLRNLNYKRASKVKAFVKRQNESLTKQPTRDLPFSIEEWNTPYCVPDPRPIQFRSDEWLTSFFPMKHFEEAVYNSKGLFNTFDPTPEVVKCLTPKQKFDLLEKKMERINNPVVISWDGKRWDAHLNSLALGVEHLVYETFVKYRQPHFYKQFREMLKYQINNKCRGKTYDGAIKYSVLGNRMSGDWNTSLGNVICMCLFVMQAMEEMHIPKEAFSIMDDGDDCLVVVDKQYSDKIVKDLPSLFIRFGQEIQLEDPVDKSSLYNLEFCQCRPVQLERGGTFVRDFRKALGTYCNSYRWFREESSTRTYMSAVGLGDACLFYGVPVLWELANKFYQLANKTVKSSDILKLGIYRFKEIKYSHDCLIRPEISMQDRVEFSKAFGYTPLQQLDLEHHIREHLTFDTLVS
jgi:hypothetical protein